MRTLEQYGYPESHHCFAKYLDIGITLQRVGVVANAHEPVILLKYILPPAFVADHSECPTSTAGFTLSQRGAKNALVLKGMVLVTIQC